MKSNNSKIAKKSEKNQEKSNKPVQLFSVKGKKLELHFVDDNISSDGGALLLKEVENQIGIVEAIHSVISDNRHQSYVEHEQKSVLMQRVLQIACAYEDANDCNSLNDDPIFKLCTGNLPETDNDLASQPTMSRMENAISRTELYKIAVAIATDFINSYTEAPDVIVLDFDDTNNNVYGNQQLSFFNNYYGEYCFMPLHIYVRNKR